MKRTITSFLAMLAICTSSIAYAWGEREQDVLRGVVAGIGAVLLHNHVAKSKGIRFEDEEKVVYRSRSHRGSEYRDMVCHDNPYCGNPRLARAYEQGRKQRQKEVAAQLEKEAYERGCREN